MFWNKVNEHCDKLANDNALQTAEEDDDHEFFIDELKKSGYVLGKVCNEAQTAILKVNK